MNGCCGLKLLTHSTHSIHSLTIVFNPQHPFIIVLTHSIHSF